MKRNIIIGIIIIIIIALTLLVIKNKKGNGEKVINENQTEIKEIPSNYYNKAKEQGKLEELYYDTYESKTYNEKSKKLNKRAIVYTPYGYDETKKYNIIYIMHGGWSNETTSLGTPDNPGQFKNVIDNAIQNGDIEPIIIVCPTYNNESSDDSGDYTLAYYTLTVNYHNELRNDLIPVVESKYSTYAESAKEEDIIKSREHRAFGGFSMGSVTTWHTFMNNLDEFKYFITSSGAVSSSDIDNSVKRQGYTNKDFFMMSFTGTEDFAGDGFEGLINDLLNKPSNNFIAGTNENNGNLYFRVKDGYTHDHLAFMTYMYNGIIGFWGNKSSINTEGEFTLDTKVVDVINNESFGDFGRLLFPLNSTIDNDITLRDAEDLIMWYSNIQPDTTVNIMNYLKNQADSGNKIFYDIYTDEEKKKNPDLENTGLFFFKGNPNEKFAIVSAGGGFVFVGALHDSFPHCLELAKQGYNAFALIYRPGANTGTEDLLRAIKFIREHKDELEVDIDNYSLWGGSAGARLSAWAGNEAKPQPSAVIMQYTGLSEVTGNEPPTYACVGTNDGIANYKTMENRINRIKANGTNAKIEIFDGLSHGFGLGEKTVADGWINNAIKFWEENSK